MIPKILLSVKFFCIFIGYLLCITPLPSEFFKDQTQKNARKVLKQQCFLSVLLVAFSALRQSFEKFPVWIIFELFWEKAFVRSDFKKVSARPHRALHKDFEMNHAAYLFIFCSMKKC